MKRRLERAEAIEDSPLPKLFAALFGCFLGLALLKFGNPPIMEKWVTPPANSYELVLGNPWPIRWAYVLLGLLGIMAVFVGRWKVNGHAGLLALPAAWLVWEAIASASTLNPELTHPVLGHFLACVVCFYIAFFCLADKRHVVWLWPGLVCALILMMVVGWQQHFGGLDQTRRYFFLYIYPRLREVPPEYLKKISSTRIFATLFYPNALAGAVLLLLPSTLQFIWQARQKFTQGARIFLVGAISIGALACLYWSGSKGGWLLMLALGLIWLLRLPFSPMLKRALITTVLVLGLAVFFARYSGFFQRGATSVGARFDYWNAAVRTALAHPLFGTGPGTFSIAYQKVKRPESEMARLVHNDYLEQASDSGVPGFVLYCAFIVGVLVVTFPRSQPLADSGSDEVVGGKSRMTSSKLQAQSVAGDQAANPMAFGGSLQFVTWLGVLGWALQGFMEFGLYIPGLAWPAFAFLGLLLRHAYGGRVQLRAAGSATPGPPF